MLAHDLVTDDDIDHALHDADAAGSPDEVIARIQAAVDDPARRGAGFSVGYAVAMVSDLHLRFGRPEKAEAVLRAAVEAGTRDELFDPRASLAALLVGFGRRDEAAAEFAELKKTDRAGDSYLTYGEALEAAGDLDGAADVFAAGEVVAERAGDTSLATMLHRSADRARKGGVAGLPIVAVPALARPQPLFGEDWADELAVPAADVLSVLFWPRAEHERLVREWPALGEAVGADWDGHRTLLERLLTSAADEGEVAVLAVADVESFAALAGDAPSGTALDEFATRRAGSLPTIAWPPERNAACWCGSGQKYKRCCRPRGFA